MLILNRTGLFLAGASLLIGGLISCQRIEDSSGTNVDSLSSKERLSEENTEVVYVEEGNARSGSLDYRIDLISAVDFIKRRGETPAKADLPQLSKEHVLILEIEDFEAKTGIYSSKRLKVSEESLTRYMMSGVLQDLMIIQSGKKHFAHTVQFDKDIGSTAGGRTLRAFFFFNDLEDSATIETQYFDRIFGAGLINLQKQKI